MSNPPDLSSKPTTTEHSSRLAAVLSTALFSVTGNLYLLFGSVVFGLLALVLSPFPRADAGTVAGRLWSKGLLLFTGSKLEVVREEDVPDGAVVYLANHSSLLDIAAIYSAAPDRVRFLAKRSLFWLPIFGWALWAAGSVPVDRGDSKRAASMLGIAKRRIESGISLAVFPEQTRGDGRRLLPFKRGGVLLALKTRVPIVPIGIAGAAAVWPKGGRIIRPGRIRVTFGPATRIHGLSSRDRKQLEAGLRTTIAELSGVPE